jgi:lipopolysaccharide/colanic/teichoic acid biosynthesis glycosyltransferase
MKRLTDLVSSGIGLLVLFPFLALIYILVRLDSKGPGFYRQIRVGKNNIDFGLWKFRTMRLNADQQGLLTVGGRDPRITRIGYYLRRYKLDELPQLINVLTGEMSLVGPRPEVRKYVSLYTKEQQEVLHVRPGITDYASIEYIQENELLAQSTDPEATYINEVMQVKLQLNLKYIREQSFWVDLKIILQTFAKIIQ